MFDSTVLAVVLVAGAAASVPAEWPATPKSTVETFHAALTEGRREAALALLDPRVQIFEQGGAEMSREEYAAEHLGEDIAFLKQVQVKVIDRTEFVSGETLGEWCRASRHWSR